MKEEYDVRKLTMLVGSIMVWWCFGGKNRDVIQVKRILTREQYHSNLQRYATPSTLSIITKITFYSKLCQNYFESGKWIHFFLNYDMSALNTWLPELLCVGMDRISKRIHKEFKRVLGLLEVSLGISSIYFFLKSLWNECQEF